MEASCVRVHFPGCKLVSRTAHCRDLRRDGRMRHGIAGQQSWIYPEGARSGAWVPRSPSGHCRSSSAPIAFSASISMCESLEHELPDGMKLEVLKQIPDKVTGRPPLLFIHGACHGAWCWQEYFLPFFSAAGYPCYAISLRGQGNSERGDLKVSGTVTSHTEDLASFVSTLDNPPVLIGHSFGGLIVQNYVAKKVSPAIFGVACMGSAAPSGNNKMLLRFLKRSIVNSIKITWMFATRSFMKDIGACREVFFSDSLPNQDLQRFYEAIGAASPLLFVDLKKLQEEVPLPTPEESPPSFVLGGEDDKIVDREAVLETAEFFGTQNYVMIPGLAHDCMLDTKWKDAAEALRGWLGNL